MAPAKTKKPVTCKYCGATNLTWFRTDNGKWLLCETPPFKHHCQNPVVVNCGGCGIDYREQDVHFENIEEDIQGYDVLTFTCPKGHLAKSLRRG